MKNLDQYTLEFIFSDQSEGVDPPFDGSENTNYEAYSSRLFILYTTCLLDHSFDFLHLNIPQHPGPQKYEISYETHAKLYFHTKITDFEKLYNTI
jgi:hypothetical protein